jgi:acetyltransferase
MTDTGFSNLSPEVCQAILRPKTLAVVGARDGLRNVRWLLRQGYRGAIYPVNPKYTTVDGLKCYRSLRDIPGEVEAVLSLVRAEIVPNVLEEAAAKRARVVTIYAAPVPSEEGTLRETIRTYVAQAGLRVIGPNALGVVSIKDGAASGYNAALEVDDVTFRPGCVAIVTASGGVGDSILIELLHRGVGVSYLFHPGNEADLTIADMLRLAVQQPDVGVIAMYIEGIRCPARFTDACHAALAAGKIIVALKVGRSEEGKRAAYGHTGAIMTNDDVFNAFCARYGVVRVDDIVELITTTQMFAAYWPELPTKGRVAMVSASGGVTTLMAEAAGQTGTPLAVFSRETTQRCGELLKFAHVDNPLDLTGQALADPGVLAQVLGAVARDEDVAAVLYGIGLAIRGGVPAAVVDACRHIRSEVGKPVAAVMLASSQYKRGYHLLEDAGVPLFREGIGVAVKAVNRFVGRSVTAEKLRGRLESYQRGRQVAVKGGMAGTEPTGGCGRLNEWQVKQLLASRGLPVARGGLAADVEEATRIAASIGYPVVLKVVSQDIVHKTEAGAVALGIRGESELVAAYGEVMANVQRVRPEARIAGVLVEEMVGGIEVIVGFLADETFGPVITVGTGGIYVEVLNDVAWRLAPVSEDEVLEMIAELQFLPKLLQGRRGMQKGDVQALAGFVARFSTAVLELWPEARMVEVNPLKVLPEGQGVKVVDARLSVQG